MRWTRRLGREGSSRFQRFQKFRGFGCCGRGRNYPRLANSGRTWGTKMKGFKVSRFQGFGCCGEEKLPQVSPTAGRDLGHPTSLGTPTRAKLGTKIKVLEFQSFKSYPIFADCGQIMGHQKRLSFHVSGSSLYGFGMPNLARNFGTLTMARLMVPEPISNWSTLADTRIR